jgi:site-specific DNA recombinase
MKDQTPRRSLRGAIYTRVSTDQGLEKDFNSLDAQREACEAYIKSQAHEGWRLVRDRYDDGGFSGGSMERPALQKLLADVEARRIDVIVDRLTRSLADFAKLVETFDAHGVSLVSVTQSFNTTTSMGRCCCPSPSSSGGSRGSASGTRSPLRRRRGCGWVA